ncbi:Coupling of ubiquitin conjugation to ER degradation protein 1 [Candida viswanathii]|uniref:Coupling of ubiquitin conjugation to ER degradation protein 1 n=1 Tax=Candida viswanathii TaxID=5486 RepID=A0A367YG97_9ASCO|nr:Coupling of ubiquitin conjugation to ER degradation protein 1 [Candida viswanathii]
MDSSTIAFVGTALVVFVFLKWMISPIPQPHEFTTTTTTNTTPEDLATRASATGSNPRLSREGSSPSASSVTSTQSRRGGRRQVTDSMIEVVQSIAPMLTVEQIRYDLENTGNVEATVNRFMELGDLPFPPGYVAPPPPPPAPEPTQQQLKKDVLLGKRSVNLLEKYHIDVDNPSENTENTLQQKREEMILNARRRLAAQLRNDL